MIKWFWIIIMSSNNTPEEIRPKKYLLWSIHSGCSTTVIVEETLEEAKDKFFELLVSSEQDIKNHPGYYPGRFTYGGLILGKGDFGPWANYYDEKTKTMIEPQITRELFETYIERNVIVFKSQPLNGAVMTDYLDG